MLSTQLSLGASGLGMLASVYAQSQPQDAFTLQTIDMPLNHFDSDDTRTYQNRFFVNSTYYDGGPVFFFDLGEEGVTRGFIDTYLSPSDGTFSVPVALAQDFKGLAILWEHRMFGESYPLDFTIDASTGLFEQGWDAYQYLTIEQALEDVVYFANNFNSTMPNLQNSLDQLKPANTPWIMLGGSYPGARAAVLRVRNPDVIYASWASSAPVEAMADMSSYNEPLERVLPANCSADIKAAVSIFDSTFQGSNQTAIQQLGLELGLAVSKVPYADFDSDFIQTVQQTASHSGPLEVATAIDEWSTTWQEHGLLYIGPFCDHLESFNPQYLATDATAYIFTNDFSGTPSDLGIAATYNDSNILLSAFIGATYLATLPPQNNATNSTLPPGDDETVQIDYNTIFPGDSAAWGWIRTTEFGNWQTTNTSSSINLFSSLKTLQVNEAADDMTYGFPLPAGSPDLNALNKYGGWNMNPSNVMWTNGDWDGWMTRTPMATVEDGGPARKPVQDVPACNSPPDQSSVFGLLYPGVGHASDFFSQGPKPGFNSSEEPAFTGYDLFKQALEVWLPCFQPHNVTSEAVPSAAGAGPTATLSGTAALASPTATGWNKNSADRPSVRGLSFVGTLGVLLLSCFML